MSYFKRVVCGISGGVDSAVAAFLLQKRGFEVIGLFMKNWDNRDEAGSCLSVETELEDARSVCKHIGIPLLEANFVKDYWNDVFSVFLEDYENGLTTNPDILCNRYVKFGAFFKYAINKLGADAIATGHYANSSFGPFLENYACDEKVDLKRAKDPTKDQTLFLSEIPQTSLKKTMFPLGNLYKHQVRQIAQSAGMDAISKKQDSVGICFIGSRKFSHFISEYIVNKPGAFIDLDTGKTVGQHNGIHQWTIGQRCKIGGLKTPHYVVHMNAKTQNILVVSSRDHPALYTNDILTLPPHWISITPPLSATIPFHCMFKFQHTEWTVPCQILSTEKDKLLIYLSICTRAVTPGQHAVFYHNDVCLGSAKILAAKRNEDLKLKLCAPSIGTN